LAEGWTKKPEKREKKESGAKKMSQIRGRKNERIAVCKTLLGGAITKRQMIRAEN